MITRGVVAGLVAVVLLSLGVGCRRDMQDQPKYKPLRLSKFFADRRDSRPLVPGTVARGHLDDDPQFYLGKVGDALATTFPAPVTHAMLERGRQRYDVFCAPCHDRVGTGKGMIVLRGYRQPPSFHIDRLKDAAVGYYFDVMTHGFGVMPGYAEQIVPADRWAITSYIRALQLSQAATLADVPEAARAKLVGTP